MRGFGYHSLGDLRAARDARLRRFLREQVAAYHPWYRRRFAEAGLDVAKVRGVADLARLPFTSKADLLPSAEHPDRHMQFLLQPTAELLARHAPLGGRLRLLAERLVHGPAAARRLVEREYRPVFMTWTTGRSSRPIPFLYTLHDIELLKLAGRRLIDVMGMPPDAKTVNLFPYAPHLAFWQVQMAGFAHGVMVVGTGGGRILGTDGTVQLLERMQPETIAGVPSFVYHVLRRAARSDVRLPALKRVALGAEKVPPGMKDKMREALVGMGAQDPAIFGTYGFTEARMAFAENPESDAGGYVLYPDLGVLEIVDPATGAVLPDDADGELVYTPLDGRGTVVVRFRTGDLVRGGIRYQQIPRLGGLLPVLAADITRVSNIREMDLRKVKGTLVNLNELASVLSGSGEIDEWQVEIRKKDDDPYEVDELVILVAPKDGRVTDRQVFTEELKSRVQVACEIQPNEVKFLPLDDLVARLGLETEMKEKRIVDRRPGK